MFQSGFCVKLVFEIWYISVVLLHSFKQQILTHKMSVKKKWLKNRSFFSRLLLKDNKWQFFLIFIFLSIHLLFYSEYKIDQRVCLSTKLYGFEFQFNINYYMPWFLTLPINVSSLILSRLSHMKLNKQLFIFFIKSSSGKGSIEAT